MLWIIPTFVPELTSGEERLVGRSAHTHTHTHLVMVVVVGGCGRGDPACTLTLAQNNVGAREIHICARRLSQFVISQIM